MVVREDMLSGFGAPATGAACLRHATDMAFRHAARNSYGEMTVASGYDVDHVRPRQARRDAHRRCARVVSPGARMGVYDIYRHQHQAAGASPCSAAAFVPAGRATAGRPDHTSPCPSGTNAMPVKRSGSLAEL